MSEPPGWKKIKTLIALLGQFIVKDSSENFAAFKSRGDAAATGYQIADGTDLSELFGKLDAVENAAAGSGAYVSNVTLSVNGKNAKLTQTKAAASYCTYCTNCTYCTYCSYCGYCSYCAGNCGCI
jgi:hypothetical protein